MPIEASVYLLIMAAIFLWISAPLIPAILIYKLFPHTKLDIKGPLQGLQLNATGAFAAYLVILILMWAAIGSAIETARSFLKTYWTVTANIALIGEYNEPLGGMVLDTIPRNSFAHDNGRLEWTAKGTDENDLPTLYLKFPSGCDISVRLQDKEYQVNAHKRTIALKERLFVDPAEGVCTCAVGESRTTSCG